jgi:hypothetical protein
MTQLSDAWTFLERFVELDHEAQRSRYDEPDEQLGPKLARLNALFDDEMRLASAISRPANLSTAELAEQRRAHLPDVRPRRVFGVDEYADARFGRIFACHLSEPRADALEQRTVVLYLAPFASELRIVSCDRRCGECQGEGRFGDRKCDRCNGARWLHSDGATLSLGERLGTRMPG